MYQRQDYRNYSLVQLLYVHQQVCVLSVHGRVAAVTRVADNEVWSLVHILLDATKEVIVY